MSTERRRERVRRARRGYRRALLAVCAVLALVVVAGGAWSVAQGPRLSRVDGDPAVAASHPGARIILRANQALAPVDEGDVMVEPAADVTVTTSGRDIGVRFTHPLDARTRYTVTVRGAVAASGGPARDLVAEFETPAVPLYVLRRGADRDRIVRIEVEEERESTVYSADRIEDFRVTSDALVMLEGEAGENRLITTSLDGREPRELPLPGPGTISQLQVSDRGDLVGYSFTDARITEDTGRKSVLFTQPLRSDAAPLAVRVGGNEASALLWRFVPASRGFLLIDFDGTLSLAEPERDPVPLGVAQAIAALSPGSYTAVVLRADGFFSVDLRTGKDTRLDDRAAGADAVSVTMLPDGGTIQDIVHRDADGAPTGEEIVRVASDGTRETLHEVPLADAVLQVCVSPSGEYVAVSSAPDVVTNGYDLYENSLPQRPVVEVLSARDGAPVSVVDGAVPSWCEAGPW